MADVAIQRGRVHRIRDGYVYEGTAKFNSTDATGTLAVKSAQRIRNVQLTWAGAPATDETLYGPAPNAAGYIALSGGKFTVGRTGGSPTSALAFNFRVEYE